MINGGFQNYLHMMYGLPNGFIQAKAQPDTSDILSRGAKRRRKQQDEEERLAIDILLARQMQAAEQAGIIDAQAKLQLKEIARSTKQKEDVIKWLLMAMELDDI